MSTATSYPGVYIEEDASPSISVSNAPTAVPVFIGTFALASGAALTASQCIRISNWLEFSSKYSFDPVVSVAITSTAAKSEDDEESGNLTAGYTYSYTVTVNRNSSLDVQIYFQNGGGPCYILPILNQSNTAELNALASAIQKENDITLLVPVGEPGNFDSYLNPLLTSGYGYFYITSSADGRTVPATQPDQTAVYYPTLMTSYTLSRPADSLISVTGYKNDAGNSVSNMADLSRYDSATYATVSEGIDAKLASTVVLLANSAMAGIYCSTDAKRGVWKAPANVTLSGTTGVSAVVTDDFNGTMNSAGINAIRSFVNRGTVVWGARTLAGTSSGDTSWRYIPVRRLFNSAERDIKKSMQTMVFEPNNQPTWEKVRAAIENYLHTLWTQGALAGATPKDAYFVQIGEGVTMSADDIAQGKMIATVGMAAVRPAEFIILQFTQNMSL